MVQNQSLTPDTAGNTAERWTGNIITSGGSFQKSTLTYDQQGRLATLTTAGQTISYLYDAAGGHLSRRDSSTTTLYLADAHVTLNRATGQLAAERYYTFNGAAIAVRTGSNNTQVSWVITDLNNTAGWQLRSTDSAVTTRRTTPFGRPRGTTTGWVGHQGFVGGTTDPEAGFTRLGARDYDTHTARFLTIDPILDPEQPIQWNPYAYGYWDPTTNPDPSGLLPGGRQCVDECGSVQDRAANGMGPAPGQSAPGNPAPTVITPPKPDAKEPQTFAEGFAKGAGAGAMDEFRDLNPITLLSNAVNLFKQPLTPSAAWAMFKGAISDAIHFEELKGLITSLQAGDQGQAGYWLGKLTVKVSVDVLELLVGAKIAKTLIKAVNIKPAKTAANTVRTFGTHSADDLLQAGLRADRNGLTGVGRALQKHANRPNSAYPQVAGRDLNSSGQQVLERILRDPRTAVQTYKHPNSTYGGGVMDLRLPDIGARFSSTGDFIGFL